jgi:hypothetical protein
MREALLQVIPGHAEGVTPQSIRRSTGEYEIRARRYAALRYDGRIENAP